MATWVVHTNINTRLVKTSMVYVTSTTILNSALFQATLTFFLTQQNCIFRCLKHQKVVRSGSTSLSLLPRKVTGSIPGGGIQHLLLTVKISSPILVTDMFSALKSQTRTERHILIFIYSYNKKYSFRIKNWYWIIVYIMQRYCNNMNYDRKRQL